MGEKFDEAEIRPLRRKPSHYLLKPEERVTFSRYFFEKWVPLLGPTRSMVILKFRSFCAGKNSVVLRMADAAKAIGISERHLRRVLQDERVKRFIKKEAQFEREGNGEVRQIANRFWVLQEDPLTPEDEFKVEDVPGWQKSRGGQKGRAKTERRRRCCFATTSGNFGWTKGGAKSPFDGRCQRGGRCEVGLQVFSPRNPAANRVAELQEADKKQGRDVGESDRGGMGGTV
jgi:hypothetical protein